MFLLFFAFIFIIISIFSIPGINTSTKYVKQDDTESELKFKDVKMPSILLSITLLIIIIVFTLQFDPIITSINNMYHNISVIKNNNTATSPF